jgi:hypothetical protein
MPKKRHPTPRISYQDVAEAAAALISQGLEPGPNAVFRELGERGSLTTIQRHLKAWNGRQSLSLAPLSVTAADVASLSPADFVRLINHLARREALEKSPSAIVNTTVATNIPDEGIDGTAYCEEGEPTQYLPALDVVWQSKAGDRLTPPRFAKEIAPGGALRPSIRAAFERGGAYVIYIAADMTPDQKEKALRAMRTYVPSKFHGHIHVVAGDDIAAWASRDLWARTYLIRSAGRNGPGTLIAFEEWERRLKNPYVLPEEHRVEAEKLRTALEMPGAAYRVGGTPGIGKTRFVLEAVRELPHAGHRVVYYDARPFEEHRALLDGIQNWRQLNVSGVLVLDNCDSALHQEISNAISGSRICAVTICEKREGKPNFELNELPREVIQQILVQSSEQPNHHAIHIAIRYAEGWPSIALRVYEAIKNGDEDASTLTDEMLTRRLVHLTGEADELAVLRALSIFDHVGFRENVAGQWKIVRDLVTNDVKERRFREIAWEYEKLGIVRSHGRFWRVGPPPLAIRLVKEWLDQTSPDVLDNLFATLPDDMQHAIGARLEEISTPAAVDIVTKLLTKGRFGQPDHIFTREGSHMLTSLAKVAPRPTVDALQNAIFDSGVDLASISRNEGRQNLVFALEYIAFHEDCFKDAARCLLALARAENGDNSNNATGTLAKFFSIQGSQTEAPPALRYNIIEKTLMYSDNDTIDTAAKILATMLSDRGGYITLGPEIQGGRPPLVEWRPKYWQEIFDYWASGVGYCIQLAQLGEIGRTAARRAFADSLITLVRHRQWDSVKKGLEELKGGAWPKAIDHLTWLVRVGLQGYDKADVAEAEKLLELVQPDTLDSTIEVRLINPPREMYEDENGQFRNYADDRAKEFARGTLADGTLQYVLNRIAARRSGQIIVYGITLAQEHPSPESLTTMALDAYRDAPKPRSDLTLLGIFSVLAENKPELCQQLFDVIAADQDLVDLLPVVSTVPFATDRDVRRLVEAYRSEALGEPREMAFMGKRFSRASTENVRELVAALIERKYFSAVFELLTYGLGSSKPYLDLYARAIVAADVINNELPQAVDYSVLEKARKLIEGGDIVFASAVASALMDRALADHAIWERERGSDLWPTLLKHGGETVWCQFQQRFSAIAERERWRLLSGLQYRRQGGVDHRLALEEIGQERLIEFARQYPDDVPAFLARDGNAVSVEARLLPEGAEENVRVSGLFVKLLDEFGERDDVLGALGNGLNSFVSVGPRAPYYARRLQLIESIPTFDRPKLESWKRKLRADFEAERKRAGIHDEELAGGIF